MSESSSFDRTVETFSPGDWTLGLMLPVGSLAGKKSCQQPRYGKQKQEQERPLIGAFPRRIRAS